MKRKNNLFAWMMAALALIIPSAALAQAAPLPVDRAAEAQTFNVEYRSPTMANVRIVIAPALDIDPAQEAILQKCGFVYGPMSIMQPLYDEAVRKEAEGKKDWGWCGRNLVSRVDDYVGKESTVSEVISEVAGGYEHCVLRKITNRGNNRDRCTFYARSSADFGRGQFTDVDRATGGDTAVGDVLGAVFTGTVNNLTGAGAQRLFSTCNGGSGCGKGNVITVNASADGGDAYAEGGNAAAGAQASSASTLNQTGTGGGTCGTGTCPTTGQPLNPDPH